MKQTIILLIAGSFLIGCDSTNSQDLTTQVKADSIFIKDYHQYWNTVHDYFAYFDSRRTNWDQVREIYQPMVDTVSSRNDFIAILEKSNNELYNGHVGLNTNTNSSSRLIPTSTDIWALYNDGKFYKGALKN